MEAESTSGGSEECLFSFYYLSCVHVFFNRDFQQSMTSCTVSSDRTNTVDRTRDACLRRGATAGSFRPVRSVFQRILLSDRSVRRSAMAESGGEAHILSSLSRALYLGPLLVKVIRSRAFGGRFESRLAVAVHDRGGRRARCVSFGRRRVLALPLASLGAGQQRAAIAGWAQERRRAARGVGAC